MVSRRLPRWQHRAYVLFALTRLRDSTRSTGAPMIVGGLVVLITM
jgi:hypothetical protein